MKLEITKKTNEELEEMLKQLKFNIMKTYGMLGNEKKKNKDAKIKNIKSMKIKESRRMIARILTEKRRRVKTS